MHRLFKNERDFAETKVLTEKKDNMNKILKASTVIFPAVLTLAACDNMSEIYKVGKNAPEVWTLDVREEHIGEDRVTLMGAVKWEQSTSDHSFDAFFAISESPDFPAGETDTLYRWDRISQEDTATCYYDETVEGLRQGTTYYYEFSITDDIIVVSGETKSFTTLGQSPDDPDNPTDGRTITLPNEIGPYPVDIEMESDWEISNKTVWFSVVPLSGDKGLHTIYINLLYVNTSSDSEKSGEFIVRYDDGREIVYTVILPPASIDELNLVMPEGVEFPVDAEGGDYDTFIPFIIENYGYEYFESHGEPALWIENGADWLSNVEYAYLEYGDDCTGYINLTADANTSGSDRTGTFTFGFEDQSYDISISQPQLDTDLGNATGQFNGHDYVDLGLSVMWATCNVGASSPSEYGDYYAWGETETKVTYTQDNCERYNEDIGDISGNIRYDVAASNWGDGWRLPTRAELEELVDMCDWVWCRNEYSWGYLVIGPNGNKIFLPAAGNYFYQKHYNAGEMGNYWSSTPDDSRTSAYDIFFHTQNGYENLYVGETTRYYGQSVRPVTDK